MKKKLFYIILFLFFFASQFLFAPRLNHVSTHNSPDGYTMSVTLTANRWFILRKKAYAKRTIESICDNSFRNMQFSYDILGYPEELDVVVYDNAFTKALHKPAFSFRYVQKNSYEYNIVEHPDKFHFLFY